MLEDDFEYDIRSSPGLRPAHVELQPDILHNLDDEIGLNVDLETPNLFAGRLKLQDQQTTHREGDATLLRNLAPNDPRLAGWALSHPRNLEEEWSSIYSSDSDSKREYTGVEQAINSGLLHGVTSRSENIWPTRPLRTRTKKSRWVLPITMIASKGEETIVMSCPDSGSDQCVISLDLAKKLNLAIGVTMRATFEASTSFTLANGSAVEAVGFARISGKFVRDPQSHDNTWSCGFYIFETLAVPVIMGLTFLEETETLTKYRDRLVHQPIQIPQALRIDCIGPSKRRIVCRLNQHVAYANTDTGSDLDLVSPHFIKSRNLRVRPGVEEIMFADGSLGYTTGVAQASFSVGILEEDKAVDFAARSDTIELEFHILDVLASDALVGQDTIDELNIFTRHQASFISNINPGKSDINIIRHIRSMHRSVSAEGASIKRWCGRKLGLGLKEGDQVITESSQGDHDDDQRENARHSAEIERIKRMGNTTEALLALRTETARYQDSTERNLSEITSPSSINDPNAHAHTLELRMPDKHSIQPEIESSMSPRWTLPSLRSGASPRIPLESFASIVSAASAASPSPPSSESCPIPSIGYRCNFPGCTASPFQTQYLLNSHANVHNGNRPLYCPVKGCPRSEGAKGFKRKNEMIRHGLVHETSGVVCPFCPDREHKYPRPDNLLRHVRVHHHDKDEDDPMLREVLASHERDRKIRIPRKPRHNQAAVG